MCKYRTFENGLKLGRNGRKVYIYLIFNTFLSPKILPSFSHFFQALSLKFLSPISPNFFHKTSENATFDDMPKVLCNFQGCMSR